MATDLRPMAVGLTGLIVGVVAGEWSPPGPLLFLLTTTLVVAVNVLLFIRGTRTPPRGQRSGWESR